MVGEETHINIPLPRLPHEGAGVGRRSLPQEALREVGAQLCKTPAVYGNGPVYAIPADAGDPETPVRIRDIKGENRKSDQPLGLTIPFSRFLPHVDMERIKHPKLRALLGSPAEMTRLFGGLAFVRAAAAEQAKTNLPPWVISQEDGAIQAYSFIGNARTTSLLMHAMRAGVKLPVMTSANRSGSHEIVDDELAAEFAEEHELSFVPNLRSISTSSKPKGSYPVIAFTRDSLHIVRQGFLSNDLMDALLMGYPVERTNMKPSNYPANLLGINDLLSQHRASTGTQLRRDILHYITNGAPTQRV